VNDSFHLVWNPSGHNPNFRHPDRDSAITEAERLARAHPGQQFFVLAATDLRIVDAMQRIELQPTVFEPPF
jgi:hypothetical protein